MSRKGLVSLWMMVGAVVLLGIAGGIYYLGKANTRPVPGRTVCTEEIKVCPDGSNVGRVGPNCEFAKCLSELKDEEIFCGGLVGKDCPNGYLCKLAGDYPDAGGVCIKDLSNSGDITNWKTYINNKLGFSIKYPPFVVPEELSNGSVYFIFKDRIDSKDLNYKLAFQILLRDAYGLKPEDAVKSDLCSSCKAEHEIFNTNNAKGIKTTLGFGSRFNYYLTDSANKGPVVRIDFGNETQSVDLEPILKSLTFTR